MYPHHRTRPKRPILTALKNPSSPFGPLPPGPNNWFYTIDPFTGRPVRPGSIASNGCPPGQVPLNGHCVASACPESAPYACTGFPGECSAYPSDHPLHGIDCKSYATPHPYAPGVAGAGMRRANPADCSSVNTPSSQCKWICLPMPHPNDPHDLHCARVPIEAQLEGGFFTSTPPASRPVLRAAPARQGVFQRLAKHVMGR